MALTRTLKFEVVFPGLRKADALHVKGSLRRMSQDLTRGANRAMSVLWLLHSGQVPWPTNDKGRPVSDETLAYRLLNGAWQPTGTPCYEPQPGVPGASGALLSVVSRDLTDRIKKDLANVRAGRQVLPTFRELPLPSRGANTTLLADGSFRLSLYGQTTDAAGKRRNPKQIRVRPKKLDANSRAVLDRLSSGAYKLGVCRLHHRARDHKWFLSVSWTDENHVVAELPETAVEAEQEGVVVAGVDTGIQHACWIAYVDALGQPLKRPDVIQFPERTLRAVARITNERRQRLEFNRAPLGLREGRGRSRKLRVVDAIGDTVERMNTTMIEQIVAATVAKIKNRGASVMVLENHGEWSATKMHRRADSRTRSEAARIRASYYRWHQGQIRDQLKKVGAREGLTVVEINPAWTSRTCHVCGLEYRERDWIKFPPKEGEVAFGRIELRTFKCSCGYEGHADHNAAINIARRGIANLVDMEKWNPRIPLFPGQRTAVEDKPRRRKKQKPVAN